MVDEAGESIVASDWAVWNAWGRVGWFEVEAAVWSFGVVVGEVLGDDALEMPIAGDQHPVEAFAADRLTKRSA